MMNVSLGQAVFVARRAPSRRRRICSLLETTALSRCFPVTSLEEIQEVVFHVWLVQIMIPTLVTTMLRPIVCVCRRVAIHRQRLDVPR